MEKRIPAWLVLEDATVFKGWSFGAEGQRTGEVVFNTSMTGYQEIITDPSYKGQIVAMTYTLMGNYGINKDDMESRRPFLEGFVVKEYSKVASNWRSEKSLGAYLKEHGIMGVEGIDTRALTLHIRQAGAMKAVISTTELDENTLVDKAGNARGLVGVDLVREVTIDKAYVWSRAAVKAKKHFKVVVLDCGVKYTILRELMRRHCAVTVVPAHTPAQDILALKPDGLLLSNGPGDPAAVGYVVETVRQLMGKLPISGICLGHQMIGLALGAKTFKLKFGHHGANHPVKDLRSGKVYITSQNHGFNVQAETLNSRKVQSTHVNLNDGTLEGLRHKKFPLFSVQFHPEAAPGPRESEYLFDEFLQMMQRRKGKHA